VPEYLADTNVYIRAANDDAFRARLEAFVRARGPLLVSSIVVAEYLIGVADPSNQGLAARALASGAEVLAPTAANWIAAGAALGKMGGVSVTKGRSFWNDALLAAQCAELGATLITQNGADFRRLQKYIGGTTAAPFPSR
jgi:predicted nucleic acid-binding protein